MQRYKPKDIESKWQKKWEVDQIYHATEDPTRPKRYVLEYFPYPSGAAMHVGHVRNYTIGDAIARYNRMNGYNVLHPMGWDAFGLPAENYALKNQISPRKAIDENTKRFKQQLMQMGFSYDWSREIDSTDPKYYRWTQWLFLLLFKRGLAYQKEALVNWDPVDKTVLANEQVIDGRADRSGAIVEKKALKQWFFKITDYADRLLEDLEDLNWSEAIKSQQRNWIGRSKGAEIEFKVSNPDEQRTQTKVTGVNVFTTRPDTIFGATFIVMAPELKDSMFIATQEKEKEVDDYIRSTQAKSEIERMETNREKTGVFTGSYAINPLSGKKMPIWIADYVIGRYGTGAIMAVPAHDDRDFEFAKEYDLEIVPVIKPDEEAVLNIKNNLAAMINHVQGESLQDKLARQKKANIDAILSGSLFYTGEGVMINSDPYDGLRSEFAREKIVADVMEKNAGQETTNYKINDWLISRQRYWGAPIPIIHCPKDGAVPVPEDQLPVVLPELEKFEPSGDGRSPLANVPEFVNTTCPVCGGPAERETDTMDGFACSSWYFLRFADPHNDKAAFARDKADFWLPVDDYIGGAEHAVMHLLYARFWTKVMYDEGLINFQEPFTTLRNHGMILAPDGQKMSKSKGNTIEPDGLIEQGYGADSIRIMELFIGPWNQSANWSVEGMGGAHRFLQRVWTLTQEFLEKEAAAEGGAIDDTIVQNDILRAVHAAIKKVSEDLVTLGFNTAIASLMECVNQLYKLKEQDGYANLATWRFTVESLLQLLAPFAPHISEELWQQLGHEESIHMSQWPVYDPQFLVQSTATVVIQVNGRLRGEVEVAVDAPEAEVVAAAKAHERAAVYMEGKTIRKTIHVPNKLVNFVV